MKIDAHQHFWRIDDRVGHWPPAELAAIHRDFLPGELKPLLDHSRVAGTVLVQSLPSDADTDFLLEIAEDNAFVLGVVGWVDMAALDAPARVERLAAHPKLKGLRPMLQDLPDDHWIADAAIAPAARAMARHGLVFDALVLPRHLPALTSFARAHDTLAIVIDHAAKPPIASGSFQSWRNSMARLAELPHVSCKLSGLLTEAPYASRKTLQPWVQSLWELFGPSRLIWGSDWPVLRLAADYHSWLDMSDALLDAVRPAVSAAERAAVFGGNAARLYRLN